MPANGGIKLDASPAIVDLERKNGHLNLIALVLELWLILPSKLNPGLRFGISRGRICPLVNVQPYRTRRDALCP